MYAYIYTYIDTHICICVTIIIKDEIMNLGEGTEEELGEGEIGVLYIRCS